MTPEQKSKLKDELAQLAVTVYGKGEFAEYREAMTETDMGELTTEMEAKALHTLLSSIINIANAGTQGLGDMSKSATSFAQVVRSAPEDLYDHDDAIRAEAHADGLREDVIDSASRVRGYIQQRQALERICDLLGITLPKEAPAETPRPVLDDSPLKSGLKN